MNKLISNNYILAILSGLLFIPGWYEWGTGLFMMLAFVPMLLIIENLVETDKGGRKLFLYTSISFIIWNIGTIWWIKNASFAGLIAALLLSTTFMSITMWLVYMVRKAWGVRGGLFALVVFWLAFEFAYLHGEVAWPWLTLGNGFAYEVRLIQWYDFTGALGGSLWVLLVNIFMYKAFFSYTNIVTLNRKWFVVALLVLLTPILISVIRYTNYVEEINPRKIVIVQPNVDPYLKFNDIPSIEQTHMQVNLAKTVLDATIDYVVAPETSIINTIWVDRLIESPDLQLIKEMQKGFPKMKYITGISCYRLYSPTDIKSSTAQEYTDKPGYFFDSFNSAIQIDSTDVIPLYHKSKLVTGVEKMPYPKLLNILKPLTLRLGGAFRSHGTQDQREVFSSANDSVKVAPVICYESVFGDYVTDYVKMGAGLLFVITNDGWWGNTPGHRQHNSFSSIRAIETRRSVARSANTGVSSFINQRGDVLQKLDWWKRGVIVEKLNVNTKLTFFTKHGDYIGRLAFFIGLFLIVSLIVKILLPSK
jgi:apolipoprotein N-acyltransferase